MPTLEEKKRARQARKSLLSAAGTLDIWTKFKVACIKRGITAKEGLAEAIKAWMKSNAKKD